MSILLAAVFKLCIAGVGFLLVRAGLIWMDRGKIGREFMERVNGWDNSSQAIYYGLRVLAAAMVVGLALS